MTDKTNTALTAAAVFAATDVLYAAVGANSRKVTGTVLAAFLATATLAAGTLTTSQPLTLTQTWNAGAVTFSGLKVNITDTASASPSSLLDLQRNSTSLFSVGNDGNLRLGATTAFIINTNSTGSIVYSAGATGGTEHLWQSSGVNTLLSTSSMLRLASAIAFGWNSLGDANSGSSLDVALLRRASASLQLGTADAAAPIAQTFGVQGVVAGTANTAGALFTIAGSQGTGSAAGGDIAFQTAPLGGAGTSQNALSEVMRILAAGNIKFTNAANFSANGAIATAMSSVGPTGSHTTVQEWLTIVNASGVTRYIPCF